MSNTQTAEELVKRWAAETGALEDDRIYVCGMMDELVRDIAYALATTAEPERHFIGSDCSGHHYLVPMSKRKQWLEWVSIPEEDERAWEAPDYAGRIDGGGLLTFAEPRIEP